MNLHKNYWTTAIQPDKLTEYVKEGTSTQRIEWTKEIPQQKLLHAESKLIMHYIETDLCVELGIG